LVSNKNYNHCCSEYSQKINENIFGTAPKVDVWLLLEYRGHWTDNAFEDSKIPGKVKEHLNNILKSIPSSRLQLIKRDNHSTDSIRLYVALTSELEPKLFKFAFSSYEELLDLNIDKILKSGERIYDELLVLICTNGSHDSCCGTNGVPVYHRAKSKEDGYETWQTIHVGGHRFSANIVCFPHGIYYGRVNALIVERIISDYRKGAILLDHYRGRSCYSKDTQAAEYFLRNEINNSKIEDIVFERLSNQSDNLIEVEFFIRNKSNKYIVKQRKLIDQLESYSSCGDKEPSKIPVHELLEIRR